MSAALAVRTWEYAAPAVPLGRVPGLRVMTTGGGGAEFAWHRASSYRFHRYHAKGYPPLEESGWYWVADQDDNTYTLKVWIPRHRGEAGKIETHVLRVLDGAYREINGFPASR